MIHTIIWDFNGTVLDDCAASVEAVNQMMARRNLGSITREWYEKNLIMPLEAFYESVGFDMQKERLPEVSAEFQVECAKVARPIFPEVLEALAYFKEQGYRQLLFSSLHQAVLEEQARERGIEKFFEKIMGRPDRNLGSKKDQAKAYLEEQGIAAKNVLFVGDLTTDHEMADYVGGVSVLIPKGHQHQTVLEKTGAHILKDASELKGFLKKMNIEKALKNLEKNRFEPYFLETKEEVVPLLKKLLKKGCSVSVGGSETLKEVGALELLGNGDYEYLDRYAKGADPREIFIKALSADAYLTSANAISEEGELINVDGNSNRIAAICYGPESVIVVAGVNKLVENAEEGLKRIKRIAAPKNAKRLSCETYCASFGICKGAEGSITAGCGGEGRICCNYLISGPQRHAGRIKVILVNEELGY